MCKGTGILAMRDNFGHVVECGCGTIHVTVGPVTLALDPHALRSLHEMLGQAIEAEECNGRQPSDPEPFLMHSSHLAVRKIVKVRH
jgi:hypothetical protein